MCWLMNYCKRAELRGFLAATLVLFSSLLLGQQQIDSTLIKAFPFRIGNIGFAVDSLEYIVGDAYRGKTQQYQLGMFNFGKEPISFKPGQISKFVTMSYEPQLLSPGQKGFAVVDFEVINEMPLGNNQVEIAVESNDTENPYKFLYLVVNIIEDSSMLEDQLIIDTVPRLVFDQYNHNFGHLSRAKSVVHTFVFTNRGSQDLVIDEITTSAECSIIPPEQTIIPPGSTGSLIVKVRTLGAFGVQHGTVSVVSNDPVNPVITLGMHGTVRIQSPPNEDPDFCLE
jgi:hypothetical protein